MAYIEKGEVKSKKSLWRLGTITDFFWAIINFINVFFVTMFSMEKSDAYKKSSGSSKKWDGGPGGGGPGSGPYGGGGGPPRPRGPRGMSDLRSNDHIVHVAVLAEDPRKNGLEEQEFLENNSQVSSVVDFLYQHQSAAAAAATRSVSTGLGISFDDNRHGGVSFAPLSVAGAAVDSPLFPSIDEDIDRELQRQDAEMDRFIRLQGERLRQVILEKIQAKQLQTLSTVERKIIQKLREKEAELEDINKKNTELEERMKQLSIEAGAWQHRANCSENMIAQLKINLQQVFTQGRDSKEGCGDSEVDDTASCCNGGRAVDFQLVFRENKNMKDSLICKVCRLNEVCMLLLPCRHLCICKECESKLSFSPLVSPRSSLAWKSICKNEIL
ncbi:hypothetical protein QJS10_CPA06g02402 [Acorus calamus]|uniref:Uncharacterized protein n=1 Tax=Acorus calamus TaxID=4465 RepID=A0AAV9ENT0_ACOCL|nr:hypothetical protein QJS10_CPA06g02402 [Acorus calamus]